MRADEVLAPQRRARGSQACSLSVSARPRARPSCAAPRLSCSRATRRSRPGLQGSRRGSLGEGGKGARGSRQQRGRRGGKALQPLVPWLPCSAPSGLGTWGLPQEVGRHSLAGGVRGGRRSVGEGSRARVCMAGSPWGWQLPAASRWWGGGRSCRRRQLGRKGELRSAGRSPAIRSGKICFLCRRFIPTKCPISQNGPSALLL